MWRNLFSNPAIVWRLAAFFGAACSPLAAQTAAIQLSAPQDVLLCGRSLQITASASDFFGATIPGYVPVWQSLNPAAASVDQKGNVQGLMPGVVGIQASDPVSGLINTYYLRVQPLRVDITPVRPAMRAGDSLHLAATAVDADGKPIPGVPFLWNSGIPGIATVAGDGTVSAGQAGAVTISAAIDSGGTGLNFSAAVQLTVYRKPDYKLTPIASSDDPAGAPILKMPKMISSAGDNFVAVIGALSNGAQGLILVANGVPRLLASSGQNVPGLNKVIERFTGVSVNSAGDVAVAVQFPAPWCDYGLLLYHQNQPPAVLDDACNLGITERAMGNNGDVVYSLWNNANNFYLRHADGTRTLIVRQGDQFSGSLVVGNLGRAMLTSTGAAILEITPVGAAQQLWRWSGTGFEKLAAVNDFLSSGRITNLDFPIQSATGDIYCLITQSDGPVRAMRYGNGTWTTVAQANSRQGNTQLGWLFTIAPAGQDGSIAVVADSANGTGVFRLTPGDPEMLAGVQSWSNVIQLSGGAAGVFYTGLIAGAPGVYKLASGGPAPLLQGGWQLPSATGASYLWENIPERASVTNPLMRSPGDLLSRAGVNSGAPLAFSGSTFGGDSVITLGPAVTSPDGKATVFMAATTGGPALLYGHDGKMDLLGDTSNNPLMAGGSRVSWMDPNWSSPFAMNSRQQFAALASIGPGTVLWRFDLAAGQTTRIANLLQPTPAGSTYSWFPQAAIDASGNVAFLGNLSDGGSAVFLWNNGQVQPLLHTGDLNAQGARINGLSGVQFAAKRVVVNASYSGGGAIQAFDGAAWSSVVASGDVLSFGRSIDYFLGGNLEANDAGDIAYEAQMQGYPSLAVRAHDGRDLLAATAAEPLPDGSWPISVYGFNITPEGNLIFVAQTYKDGKSRLTIYGAVPNP